MTRALQQRDPYLSGERTQEVAKNHQTLDGPGTNEAMLCPETSSTRYASLSQDNGTTPNNVREIASLQGDGRGVANNFLEQNNQYTLARHAESKHYTMANGCGLNGLKGAETLQTEKNPELAATDSYAGPSTPTTQQKNTLNPSLGM